MRQVSGVTVGIKDTANMGHQLNTILSLLGFLCAVTVHSQEVFDTTIVSHWPQSNAIQVGNEGRINFTIAEGKSFTTLNLKAMYVGTGTIQTIYVASPDRATIQEDQKQDFDTIPEKKHDIKIKSMKWTLAGEYAASITDTELKDFSHQFKLAAVEPTTCKLRNPDTTVEEGDIVNLDCSTRFTGPSGMIPTMQWKNEGGTDFPGYVVEDPPVDGDGPKTTPAANIPKTIMYRANLTATKDHDGMQFHCSMKFNAPDGKPPIEYTDQCSTTFWVTYHVTTIVFSPDPTPNPGRYKTGDLLNCSASGNPEPTYVWTGDTVNGPIFHNGPSLVMKEEMVGGLNTFTCKARNEVKGRSYEAQRNVTFYVTHDSTNTGSHLTAAIGLLSLISFTLMRLF